MVTAVYTLFNFAGMSMRAFNPTILEKYKGMNNEQVTTIVGVSQVCDLLGVLLGAFLMERLGRKPLVIFGFFAAGIATFVVPFTDNMVFLAAALSVQQLSNVWIYQITTVGLS